MVKHIVMASPTVVIMVAVTGIATTLVEHSSVIMVVAIDFGMPITVRSINFE